MITDIITGIKTYFDSLTIPYVTRKFYHPALEDITSLQAGLFVLNYDNLQIESMALLQNDTLQLNANIDILVPQGKTWEVIDYLISQLQENNHLNRTVLRTEIVDIDFANASQKVEAITIKIKFYK
jgi:hypothetical protein